MLFCASLVYSALRDSGASGSMVATTLSFVPARSCRERQNGVVFLDRQRFRSAALLCRCSRGRRCKQPFWATPIPEQRRLEQHNDQHHHHKSDDDARSVHTCLQINLLRRRLHKGSGQRRLLQQIPAIIAYNCIHGLVSRTFRSAQSGLSLTGYVLLIGTETIPPTVPALLHPRRLFPARL